MPRRGGAVGKHLQDNLINKYKNLFVIMKIISFQLYSFDNHLPLTGTPPSKRSRAFFASNSLLNMDLSYASKAIIFSLPIEAFLSKSSIVNFSDDY